MAGQRLQQRGRTVCAGLCQSRPVGGDHNDGADDEADDSGDQNRSTSHES
jgi:hypothetical protein